MQKPVLQLRQRDRTQFKAGSLTLLSWKDILDEFHAAPADKRNRYAVPASNNPLPRLSATSQGEGFEARFVFFGES